MGAPPIDSDAIIEALAKANGIISQAARILGCNRSTIYRRIETVQKVQAAWEEAWEVNVDFAEAQLLKKLHAGEMPAINKVLNEKGRSRGWGSAKGTEDDPAVVRIIIADGPEDP